jgi:hypothetical protein
MKSLVLIFVLCTAPLFASGYEQILDQYFQVGASLTKDSLPDAQKAAQAMNKSVPANDSAHQKELSDLAKQAQALSSAKDLTEARKVFADMTGPMKQLTSSTKLEAHEFYCPMVKKSWLQKSDKVQNPYLGKSMPTCGEKKS